MNTFPIIVRATPAVLAMEAQRAGLTPESYRLGTLKRVEVEVANALDCDAFAAEPELAEVFRDLLRQVQIAVADGPLYPHSSKGGE